MNDGGFWLVKEYFACSVIDTIKTWSVCETIISVVAFLLTAGRIPCACIGSEYGTNQQQQNEAPEASKSSTAPVSPGPMNLRDLLVFHNVARALTSSLDPDAISARNHAANGAVL